jgi:hypothetical protein
VLVALGDLGVRLLSADGRVRARWDVPADAFSVADHGASVVFVSHGEQFVDLHRLDVARRRVAHWTALRARRVLPSHDGLLAVVDDGGLAFLDVAADGVRVAWRELGPDVEVLDVARSPASLAALVVDRGPGGNGVLEAWRWSLPDLGLRARPPVRVSFWATLSYALSSTGELLVLQDAGPDRPPRLERAPLYGDPSDVTASGERQAFRVGVRAAGDLLFTLRRSPAGEVAADLFRATWGTGPPLCVRFPAGATGRSPVGARVHGDALVVCDAAGRVVAVDVRRGVTIANLVVAP